MNLLQGAGAGTGNAEAGGAGWVAPVMPPPAPVGLFQTPSSAGPSAARSPAANSDTAFSNIREYLQQNRRAPLTLPNARGVSRPAATGGWGGGGGGGGSGAGGGTPRGGTPASSYRNLYGTQQPVYSLQQPPSILGFSGPGSGARGVSGFGGAGVGNGTPRGGGNGNSYGGFGAHRSPLPVPDPISAGMGWGGHRAGTAMGLGGLSAGSKRSRDVAEFDMHDREYGRATMPRLSGPAPGGMPPPASVPYPVPGTTPAPMVSKPTTWGTATAGKEPVAAAVTTETARRIMQTLDRLAGANAGSEAEASTASPLPKPLNLSSSLNKAAASTSSLHGFRGIQRAAPAKSLAEAERRSPASMIASHVKPRVAGTVAGTSAVAASKPSTLQFNPDEFASDDNENPIGGVAADKSDGKLLASSLVATTPMRSPLGDESKTDKPAPPLFTARHSALSAAPSFAFGVPNIQAGAPGGSKPAPLASSSAKMDMTPPSLSFGRDHDEQLPEYTFGDQDDNEVDVTAFTCDELDREAVDITYTFGEDTVMPLPGVHSSAAAVLPSAAASPAALASSKPRAEPAEPDKFVAETPKVSLWGADFMKKNLEHQKKVQDAIDEDEKNAPDPKPSSLSAPSTTAPSPFAPAPPSSSVAAAAPKFSFGVSAAPAASSGGFSFGTGHPAAENKAEPPASAATSAPFGVSAASDKVTATTAFVFGNTAAGLNPAPVAATSAFVFGTQAAAGVAPVAPAPAFASGILASPDAPVPTAAAPPFAFGAAPEISQAPAPATQVAKPEVSFGTSFPTSGSLRDTSSSPAPQAIMGGGGFSFATNTSFTPPAGGIFGTVASSVVAANHSFGGSAPIDSTSAPAAAVAAPFAFGAGSTGIAGYGAVAATAINASSEGIPAASSAFAFGANAPTPSPVFGTASTSVTTFGNGLDATAVGFGGVAAPTGGFNGFGGSSAADTQAAPALGGGAFAFGANAGGTGVSTAPIASTTLFGSATGGGSVGSFGGGAGGGNLFGSSGTSGVAASNPFGGGALSDAAAAPAPSPFGGGFGAPPTPAGGILPSAYAQFGGTSGFGAPLAATGAPPPAFSGSFGGGEDGGAGGAPPPVNMPALFGSGTSGGFGAPGGGMGLSLGGGMTLGGGDASGGGSRKPVKKARRPPKR